MASPRLNAIAIATATNSTANIKKLSYNIAASCLNKLAGGHSRNSLAGITKKKNSLKKNLR